MSGREDANIQARLNDIGQGIIRLMGSVISEADNQAERRGRIQAAIDELNRYYTQLQIVPEAGMSIEMRQRVTDTKIDLLSQMQTILDDLPEESLQAMPAAAESNFLRAGTKYTRPQLAVFVRLSDLLYRYGQHKKLSFAELSPERQQEITDFVNTDVIVEARASLPPDAVAVFNKELLTFSELSRELLANIMGQDTIFPSEQKPLARKVISQTCIIVIGAKDRSFGDNVLMMGECMTVLEVIGKGGKAALGMAAADAAVPSLSAAGGTFLNAVGTVGGPVVKYSWGAPFYAFATLQHLFMYVQKQMEIREFESNPDFVYKRLFSSLSEGIQHRAIAEVVGQPPPPNPNVGMFDFARLAYRAKTFVAETLCQQWQGAIAFGTQAMNLPKNSLALCNRMGDTVNTATSIIANRVIAAKGLAGDRMFSQCHIVMLDLLKRPEYVMLNEDQNIQAILERMGLVDEEFLSFERVEQHKAEGLLTGHDHLADDNSSMGGVAGGVGDTQNDQMVWDARVDTRAEPQLMEGSNGDAIEAGPPVWANVLNPDFDYGNTLKITTNTAKNRGMGMGSKSKVQSDEGVSKPKLKPKPLVMQLPGIATPLSQLPKTLVEYQKVLNTQANPKSSKSKSKSKSKPNIKSADAAERDGQAEEGMGSESDDGGGDAAESGSRMDQGGGRSRSRKRSASKRTRRKATTKKQKSKKNKRQSRRKVRRSSSRRSRK